jgi:hypothetical protein
MMKAMAKPRLHPPKGRQMEVLYLPAEGHTVVLGTAGSGKTTLAMHRVVHLANKKLAHGGKTLLLSFNNALLRYFESFDDFDRTNIDVRTAHHFSRGVSQYARQDVLRRDMRRGASLGFYQPSDQGSSPAAPGEYNLAAPAGVPC